MSIYYLHTQMSVHSDDIFESVFQCEIDHIPPKFKKVKVKIKKDAIDFFANDDNPSHSVLVRRQEHLFTIPLENPERTDYFLLNIRELDKKIAIKYKTPQYKLFYASHIPDREVLEAPGRFDLTSIHEVLLCLFYELSNPGSDINRFSPVNALAARERLEKSAVFQLIRRKFDFYKALYEWEEARELDHKFSELKVSYHEFLSVLLQNVVTREIPVNRLASGNWFRNPEAELEDLAKLNIKHSIDRESDEDIQKFFLTKHAVINAIGMQSPVNLKVQVAGQLFTFIVFLTVFFLWLGKIFEATDILILIGLGSFFLTMIAGAVLNQRLSLYLPRVIVAVSSAWFLIIASEDLMKNQMAVPYWIIAGMLPLVILLLSLFIYSECRQHSPYYRILNFMGAYNIKILPIIIFTFNFAMVFGIIAQLLVSDAMINNSQTLQENVYSKEFDSLNIYLAKYQWYSKKLNRAEQSRTLVYSFFTSAEKNDSEFMNNQLSKPDKKGGLFAHLNTYNKVRNDLIIVDSDKEIKYVFSIKKCSNYFQFEKDKYKSVSPDVASLRNLWKDLESDGIVLYRSDSICNILIDELNEIYYNYRNYDSLIILSTFDITYDHKPNKYSPDYGFHYDPDSTKENIVSLVPFYSFQKKHFKSNISKFRLFPRMLMFQVLVVMSLALIAQLIVSDKSVTEPL